MSVQRDGGAVVGQIVQGTHGYVDFVADAAYVHANDGRGFLNQSAGNATDHGIILVNRRMALAQQAAAAYPAGTSGNGQLACVLQALRERMEMSMADEIGRASCRERVCQYV